MNLRLEDVNYTYGKDTAYESKALQYIHLNIGENEWIGIIGQTGSGKSTLIQHLNGLLRPDQGAIYYNNQNIYQDEFDQKMLCCKVGLVFQYPEHQLFASDVFEDVCFGPKNLGLSKKEIEERACKALEQVGISRELYHKSPFELSGGQQRRVAIAGVLAMNPEILILDEPTAGLDPAGKRRIFQLIEKLRKERKITVIFVSHSMEDVAKYATRLIVMQEGKIVFDQTPENVFCHQEELRSMGLDVPKITQIMSQLKTEGFEVRDNILTVEEAVEEIIKDLNKNNINNMKEIKE